MNRLPTCAPRVLPLVSGKDRRRLLHSRSDMLRRQARPATPAPALNPTAQRLRTLERTLLDHHPRRTVEDRGVCGQAAGPQQP